MAVAATPPLYPTPQTQSSLAWDNLQDHSGGATLPLGLIANGSTQVIRVFSQASLFLLEPCWYGFIQTALSWYTP